MASFNFSYSFFCLGHFSLQYKYGSFSSKKVAIVQQRVSCMLSLLVKCEWTKSKWTYILDI